MVFVSLTKIFNKSIENFGKVSSFGLAWAAIAFFGGIGGRLYWSD